ncbi:MAG TPA: DNA polymerase III subunit alpha [Bacilli bacterium]|nr:DNA polymerase III subunit alpha [Bacilli bacterium]
MNVSSGDFVHLHNHTVRGSLLDSTLTVKQLVNFASINNQKAIAVTNHGKMHDFVEFYKECKKVGIKPIIGNEIYEVDDINNEETKNDRYHLILLAKNQNGLKNLFKIVSDAHKYFYYKPIIDLNYIQKHNLGEGLICLTACQAGRLSRMATKGQYKEMLEYYNKLKATFDYVYIELQSHKTAEQVEANLTIFNFIKEYNLPYTISCDSHMLSKDGQEIHSIFVEISQDREVGESYTDCYLQTAETIYEIMTPQIGEENVTIGLQNTLQIADMVELVDIGLENDNQMPDIKKLMPAQFNSIEEWYDYLIEEGYKERGYHLKDKEFQRQRKERLVQEKPVLKALGYLDYFIMCHLLLKECHKRNIPVGLSRGSAAGCLSLYFLGVTQLDSVTWDLDFSRFANLGRKSMADIDLDISKRYRKEVIQIARDLFGEENVYPICTFNTMSTKVAIRDIGKVLDEKGIYDIPYQTRDEVAKMIPTITTLNDLGEAEEKETLLREVLFQNNKLKKYYEKYPKWFQYVMELEGLPKSLGQHAAGVIISPKPTVEYCPLCLNSDKEMMIQLEMHNAMDDLSLIKLDFLGLKTLDVIDDTLKLCNKTWDDIHVDNLDFNDKNIYEYIYKAGNTNNIFQMESYEASKMCMDCKTDNIEDVIAVNAFNRPGTKDGFPTYIKNKLYPNDVELIHPDLKQIFSKSHYVLLYQEQALELFRYAGFPEEDVDNARRAIGKKLKDEMEKLKDKFSKGLKNKNWDQEQINNVWVLMEKQAEYSFNRSHAVAYALTSYQTAYLKYYYPLEFTCACLNNEIGNYAKLSKNINEAQQMNINVLPPNINKSKRDFTIDKANNSILIGLGGIKGMGDAVIDNLIENRPFSSFEDMMEKVDKSKINIAKIIALIKAGALGKAKKQNMKKLFEYNFYQDIPQFKPVVSVTPKDLKIKYNIEIPNTVENFEEKRLEVYNQYRKKDYDEEIKERYKKKQEEFVQKYMQKQDLWEFETLSMFITSNPFEEALQYVPDFDSIANGNQATVIGIIVDIERKKDRNNNQYAFVDFYNGKKHIELIFWAKQYAKYRTGIVKQGKMVVIGEKEDDKIYVKMAKPYKIWLKEKKLTKE